MKIVFDIDGTIACGFYEDSRDEILRQYPWVAEFEQRGLFIHALKWHLIYPGVIELLKLLDEKQIRLAFFSAGVATRNELLIAELLKLALGETRYQEIKSTIKILSKDDLTPHPQDVWVKIKDLKKFIEPDEQLEDIILVDDTKRNAHPEQCTNLLHVPFIADYYDFQNAIKDPHTDQQEIRRINSAFYTSAVLCKAIEQVRLAQTPLSRALCQLRRDLLSEQYHAWLLDGEVFLKTINPELRLCTHQNFFSPAYVVTQPTDHQNNSLIREFSAHEETARQTIERVKFSAHCHIFSISKVSQNEISARQAYQDQYEIGVKDLKFFRIISSRPRGMRPMYYTL